MTQFSDTTEAGEAREIAKRINPRCLVIVRPLPPGLPSPLSVEQRMHALATCEATVGIDIGRTKPRVPPPDDLLAPAKPARKPRKANISKLIEQAEKAGKPLASITMPDGTKLDFGKAEQQGNELDQWIERHARAPEGH
jgi:hypothetical protein